MAHPRGDRDWDGAVPISNFIVRHIPRNGGEHHTAIHHDPALSLGSFSHRLRSLFVGATHLVEGQSLSQISVRW